MGLKGTILFNLQEKDYVYDINIKTIRKLIILTNLSSKMSKILTDKFRDFRITEKNKKHHTAAGLENVLKKSLGLLQRVGSRKSNKRKPGCKQ